MYTIYGLIDTGFGFGSNDFPDWTIYLAIGLVLFAIIWIPLFMLIYGCKACYAQRV